MTVPEFLAWAAAQPRGRYELVRGEIVAMAPERARHNIVKLAVARASSDAVARAGLPCTVFTDGMTVVIDNENSREPDAAVQCGVATDLDSMILEAPLIVVEVASPSSRARRHRRQAGRVFFRSEHPALSDRQSQSKNVVIHHARNETGDIATRIVTRRGDQPHAAGHGGAVRELLGT